MGFFDRKQPPPQPPAKKKADFSNVQSGKSTTAPVPAPPAPAPAPPPKVVTHTVVSGDNLSKIAKKYLGNANRWNEIYQVNKAVIGDNPNLIKPGQVLSIPSDQKATTGDPKAPKV